MFNTLVNLVNLGLNELRQPTATFWNPICSANSLKLFLVRFIPYFWMTPLVLAVCLQTLESFPYFFGLFS